MRVENVTYQELTTATEAGLLSVLDSRRHSFEVARERYNLIISRVQWTAGLLSVVTFAWIALDAITMTWPMWGVLAGERAAAGLLFWALMSYPFRPGRPDSAWAAIGALILIESTFLMAAHVTFLHFPRVEHSIFVATAYVYAPFLIAVSLSLFPLTAVESAVLSVPIFAMAAVSLASAPEFFGQVSVFATLLRLCLITAIAAIAAMSQLRFLIVLAEQAIRDSMTSALTRRTGEQRIGLHFGLAVRKQAPLAVLFIDLDDFKSINDHYGHEAGDAVLQQAAWSIRQILRRHDTLIRWGGEEFVVLLPRTGLAEARAAVERIARVGLGLRPDGRPVTASIGLAERIADDVVEPLRLVALADQRMYAAKHAGRNCFVDGSGVAARFLPLGDRVSDRAPREAAWAEPGAMPVPAAA